MPADESLITAERRKAVAGILKDLSAKDREILRLVFFEDVAREEIYHTPGRFGWTGGLGTTAYTDPAEGMIGILLSQRLMDSPEPPKLFTDFWTLAYAAME